MSRAASLAAATPASRDRYVDFLRAFSIAVVVLGHWLMAAVTFDSAGFRAGNALASMPWLQPATWVLQVMPLFFFVGGFAHLVTYDSVRSRGGRYVHFVHGRLARLLRPVSVLLAVWVPVTLLVPVPPRVAKLVVQLLWFLGVYVAMVALAPLTIRLHRRFGWRVPAVLGACAVAVDAASFGLGVSGLRWANILPVWLLAHQLGYFYRDLSRSVALGMSAAGFGALVGLTAWGPYPVSMVGMPGERVSNMAPPTVCIVALTLWLVGLAVLVRPAVTRWLARPRVWTAVVALNGVIMTVFLWHLTALLLAVFVLLPRGWFPQPAVGSGLWWATRPLWFAVLLVVLGGLVAVFGRLERPAPVAYRPTASRTPVALQASAVAGVVLVAAGVLGLALVGLSDLAGRTASVAVVTVTPLTSLLNVAAGALLLRRTVRAS